MARMTHIRWPVNLAEVTQHIPERGEHLVRYYGWYSHRQRGIRKKRERSGQAESDKLTIDRSALDTPKSATGGTHSARAMLIKRVYEVDPLECPHCGGRMKIVSFIERCQDDVIDRADSPPLRPVARTTANPFRRAGPAVDPWSNREARFPVRTLS